jgi:hypothetical protein
VGVGATTTEPIGGSGGFTPTKLPNSAMLPTEAFWVSISLGKSLHALPVNETFFAPFMTNTAATLPPSKPLSLTLTPSIRDPLTSTPVLRLSSTMLPVTVTLRMSASPEL